MSKSKKSHVFKTPKNKAKNKKITPQKSETFHEGDGIAGTNSDAWSTLEDSILSEDLQGLEITSDILEHSDHDFTLGTSASSSGKDTEEENHSTSEIPETNELNDDSLNAAEEIQLTVTNTAPDEGKEEAVPCSQSPKEPKSSKRQQFWEDEYIFTLQRLPKKSKVDEVPERHPDLSFSDTTNGQNISQSAISTDFNLGTSQIEELHDTSATSSRSPFGPFDPSSGMNSDINLTTEVKTVQTSISSNSSIHPKIEDSPDDLLSPSTSSESRYESTPRRSIFMLRPACAWTDPYKVSKMFPAWPGFQVWMEMSSDHPDLRNPDQGDRDVY